MNPAYQIPLTPAQLQCLGELTAIIGQVDEEMTRCVSGLIRADRPTTNLVLGSSKVADNSSIWAAFIRLRKKDDEDLLWLVEHALKEIEAVSRDRNDFVHAFFQHGNVMMVHAVEVDETHAHIYADVEPAYARRVRNMKRRELDELPGVRDRAARLSCLIAHITWRVGHGSWLSPWHETLSPTLPPRLDTAEARRAKGQQPRRRSSPGSRPPEK